MDSKRPWMKTGRSSCRRGAPTPRGMHWETEDSGVRAPHPHPTYPRVFSWPMARREAPRHASIVGESLAALARDVARAERPADARGQTRCIAPQRHGDTEETHERAVFSVLRCLGSLRLIPVLRIRRSQLSRWESSGSKRDQSLNTPAPAARGSRQEKQSVQIFRRILYGKVPAVRLRTWPHLAADDDHPARKDEFTLRQRRRPGRTAAIGSGQPPRDGFFAASAAGDVMER